MSTFWAQANSTNAVVDPWDFQEPAAYPPQPGRSIEITDEIRAKDAAEQAAREARNKPWTIRHELSAANLRPRAPKSSPTPKPTSTRKPATPKPARPTHAPSTPKDTRTPTMDTQTCKGGCGTPLSAYLISKGKQYANGHQDGCPSAEAPAARPEKATKIKVVAKQPVKAGIDATLEFAKKNREATIAKVVEIESIIDRCKAELIVEERHLDVLNKLIADLEPVAVMPATEGEAHTAAALEFVDETAYEAEAA